MCVCVLNSPEPICPPYPKLITFVLSRFTVSPNELKAFPRLFIWFCRPDSVENTNAVVLPQRQTKTEIDDDKGR